MVLGNGIRISTVLACPALAVALAATPAPAATLTPQEQKLVPLAKSEGAVGRKQHHYPDEEEVCA